MILLPAIDIYEGKAVRLYKGDYNQLTVYGDDPVWFSFKFKSAGADSIHIVDLEGAKTGGTPNIDIISRIVNESGLSCEIGGGIRDMKTIEKYVSAGAKRVILGTAAACHRELLKSAVKEFGDIIAVGADIKDGFIAIRGWTEKTAIFASEFFTDMCDIGVKTVICTDISKDGAMQGINSGLYKSLVKDYGIRIIASGGVSSIDDIKILKEIGVYGAIIGKAYYSGAVDLKEALEVAKC